MVDRLGGLGIENLKFWKLVMGRREIGGFKHFYRGLWALTRFSSSLFFASVSFRDDKSLSFSLRISIGC